MTNNELLKLIYPTYEAPKCAECGKEVNLSMEEIYSRCLVSHKDFLEGKFKGLCPECTQNWRYKINSQSPKGYNTIIMTIDELGEF